MSTCWECGKLVSHIYGHDTRCSIPQKHEEHAELPGPVRYDVSLSCGHHKYYWNRVTVGMWLSCWDGIDPTRCQTQRRVISCCVIEKKSSGKVSRRVATVPQTRYTGRLPETKNSTRQNKERTMPRTARAAAPVEEVVEEAEDFAVYADKNITDTMADFADWIVEEVYGGDENAFRKASSERIVALAGTLRMKFQASDMNIERREQRKLERQSAAPEPEPEAAPAKPARRGRVAAAPEPEAAPAKPARRGRVAAAEAAPAKPARRGRVAAAAAAPY